LSLDPPRRWRAERLGIEAVVDGLVDLHLGEVHAHHKGGAAYGSTRQLGFHPLLATRADTGEVLPTRQRTGPGRLPPPRHPLLDHGAPDPTVTEAIAAIPERAWTEIAAWLVITALAHKLLRWVAALGLKQRPGGRQDPAAPPAAPARPLTGSARRPPLPQPARRYLRPPPRSPSPTTRCTSSPSTAGCGRARLGCGRW
jgi:hypothetical protein